MPCFLLWLPRVAADSKTSRSLCRHSGAAFFTNDNTICSLFYLFCFFVYLVASINKLELELNTNKTMLSTEQFFHKKKEKNIYTLLKKLSLLLLGSIMVLDVFS